MNIQIAGMGRFLPQRVVTTEELAVEHGLDPDMVKKLSGVHERRWVTDETAPGMAASAAREALENAGISWKDLDLVINASGTPWQVIPDGSALMQKEFGKGHPGFSVHSTCLSFLSALQIAAAFLQARTHEHILITSSEICSKALNFQEPDSAFLFGDGAVAAVVTRTPPESQSEMLTCLFETQPEASALAEIRGGGSRRHPSNPETVPEDNMFHMHGASLMRHAVYHLPRFLERVCPGLSKGTVDIDRFFPHQASRKAHDLLLRFGWPANKIESTLATTGNMVAASVPVALYQAWTEKRLQRGDKILLIGTGAGFSMGAIILRY